MLRRERVGVEEDCLDGEQTSPSCRSSGHRWADPADSGITHAPKSSKARRRRNPGLHRRTVARAGEANARSETRARPPTAQSVPERARSPLRRQTRDDLHPPLAARALENVLEEHPPDQRGTGQPIWAFGTFGAFGDAASPARGRRFRAAGFVERTIPALAANAGAKPPK
jgi:hypothetical protein